MFFLLPWAAFTVWTAWSALVDLGLLFGEGQNKFGTFLLYFNIWSPAATLVFALMVINPWRWGDGKRFTLCMTALAMMLGRLTIG